METNDVAIVATGTALWAVALVVLLGLTATGSDIRSWWWQMCIAGIVMGLLGTRSCLRRRDSGRQDV
jgi:hypothetical protein